MKIQRNSGRSWRQDDWRISGLAYQLKRAWLRLIADAHRDDGKRFVVRADEKLTAFLELESAVRAATNCLD